MIGQPERNAGSAIIRETRLFTSLPESALARGSTPLSISCKLEINCYITRMIKRLADAMLRKNLADYPAVVIVGPRQCGKTTLAKSIGGEYFDLEQDRDRLRLDLEWDRLCAGRTRVILDEAQTWPALFPRLRGAIDAKRRRNGRFLLLGSVSPNLMKSVSESLAGRMAVLELTPLLSSELSAKVARERHWLCGGFPDGGVQTPRKFPDWANHYVRLLAERDLPNLGLPCAPQITMRLIRMLAALNGQQWNASEVGRSMGMSYQTMNSYTNFLEGTFLIRRLGVFHGNLRKRLVKSAKLLWRDSGILHSLLGIENQSSLLIHPAIGASWEAYVVEQALGLLNALGARYNATHFRTSDGYEADLVLECAHERWVVEIKLTSDPGARVFDRLDVCADLVKATRRVLVSRVPQDSVNDTRLSCGLDRFLKEIFELARRA